MPPTRLRNPEHTYPDRYAEACANLGMDPDADLFRGERVAVWDEVCRLDAEEPWPDGLWSLEEHDAGVAQAMALDPWGPVIDMHLIDPFDSIGTWSA